MVLQGIEKEKCNLKKSIAGVPILSVNQAFVKSWGELRVNYQTFYAKINLI